MCRRISTPLGALVVALVAILASLPASAAKPEKDFPDFAARKATLGPVAMVADVVVVEDVIGTTEKVYLEDCKALGRSLLRIFDEGLTAKGYTFGRQTLVSVGHVVDPKLEYRILQTWDQHTEEDSKFPVMAPPFYEDSTLCADPGARAAWHAVLNGTWAYKKKKKEPAPVLSEAAALRDSLGSDYAFVIVVVGTKVPFGKQLGQSMLSGLTHGPVASSGNVTFSAGVNFTQYSGTGIRVAMVDCRSGEVLWSDGDHENKGIKEGNAQQLAKDILKRLP